MDKTVTIQCFDNCTYNLLFPRFAMEMRKPALRKIFKWLFQFDWVNQSAIKFFDWEFPQLIEEIEKTRIPEAKEAWRKESIKYQNEYRNPDPRFFPPMTKKEQRKKIAEIKKGNAALMKYVKEAKAAHDQAKKDLEHAKEVYEMYQSEKR